MTTLNYGISVTPDTINVLPTYIKNWHINTADLVVSDQSTHATELAYIQSLKLIPRIDIEMVIWAGGQIQDPIADYSGYLTSLHTAGWRNVASEGGRPGDASYLKSLGLGYVNYNCDQCGLWSAGAHTDPGTVLNLWESYYPSEVPYILQGAASGKPNGVLAGAWSDSGGDNAILTNSLSGSTPSYKSIIDALIAAGHTVTDFEVWCGTAGPSNVSALGFDQVVATLQESYAPNGNTPVPPTPKPNTNATVLTTGFHSINPTTKQLVVEGQTRTVNGVAPNNVVNFRWANSPHAATAAYVGAVTSDANGNYAATVPLKTGANYFWIVLGNGEAGRWTTDVIWI